MAYSNEQSTPVPVEGSSRKRKLPPFGPNESLVDDIPTFQSQKSGTASLSQPRVDARMRLSWSLPACYIDDRDDESEISIIDMLKLPEYFQYDLDLSTYDSIEKYLWWASYGTDQPALHEYPIRRISICLTEDHIGHQVCKREIVFFKPLPEYLLSHTMWDYYLCRDDELYANAIGLLRSYLILVRSKSDFNIAKDNHLMPAGITWHQWSSFSCSCLPRCHLVLCNPRYWFGPLDEFRLTWIYRLSPETFRLKYIMSHFIGFTFSSWRYIEEKTKWLIGALVYLTIVLTAMQVGLATDQLGGNETFNRASFIFTIFSMLAPLAIFFGVTAIAVLQNSLLTLNRLQQRKLFRDRARY